MTAIDWFTNKYGAKYASVGELTFADMEDFAASEVERVAGGLADRLTSARNLLTLEGYVIACHPIMGEIDAALTAYNEAQGKKDAIRPVIASEVERVLERAAQECQKLEDAWANNRDLVCSGAASVCKDAIRALKGQG